MAENENKTKWWKWLIVVSVIFFILVVLPIGIFFVFELKYENRIFPGVHVGILDVGGLTIEEAKIAVNRRIDELSQEGVLFRYHNESSILYPILASLQGDIIREAFSFDAENSVKAAYDYGRHGNLWPDVYRQIYAFFNTRTVPASFTLNENGLNQYFEDNFSRYSTPAKDAKLVYNKSGYNAYDFSVNVEVYGQQLDYNQAAADLKRNLAALNDQAIEFTAAIDYPRIFAGDALNIDAKAQKILALAPLSLSSDGKTWSVDKATLVGWLALRMNTATATDDKLIVGLDPDVVAAYLEDTIAPTVNRDPIDAKFEIKDGKVSEFQVSQDGRKLSTADNLDLIEEQLAYYGNNNIRLLTQETKSEISTDDINDMGVKEIIGTGHSDFSGSSANRRHNISVGADTLNGLLIAPDVEFSLLGALGDIDKEAGYLPELVIRDGKTTPEYGGGLCQIGTTMFRTTIESGLPVTERRNHSFRVHYYEPAGTDATIYDPWPDYKFKNDTGNYILIQSRMEDNDLYFDFWGTSDGRVATHTPPTIYNYVKPPPTKTIETLDLKPGEKHCTESAVSGADAYFDYSVTYADGHTDDTRFKSHYVPWQAVCLVGVESLSTSTVPVAN